MIQQASFDDQARITWDEVTPRRPKGQALLQGAWPSMWQIKAKEETMEIITGTCGKIYGGADGYDHACTLPVEGTGDVFALDSTIPHAGPHSGPIIEYDGKLLRSDGTWAD